MKASTKALEGKIIVLEQLEEVLYDFKKHRVMKIKLFKHI